MEGPLTTWKADGSRMPYAIGSRKPLPSVSRLTTSFATASAGSLRPLLGPEAPYHSRYLMMEFLGRRRLSWIISSCTTAHQPRLKGLAEPQSIDLKRVQ